VSFIQTVRRAREILKEEGRITLRGLKREFDLGDDVLDELVAELVEAQSCSTQHAFDYTERTHPRKVP
jgi:hypothetical protein